MGEAVYYMMTRWPSADAAEKALPQVERFLRRMREAEDLWQEVRGGGKTEPERIAHRLSGGETTYQALWGRFPDVFDALGLPKELGRNVSDGMNFLAGQLDSPFGNEGWEIVREGKAIKFKGTVWHCAEWGPLSQAMESFGAKLVVWESNEGDDKAEERWREGAYARD